MIQAFFLNGVISFELGYVFFLMCENIHFSRNFDLPLKKVVVYLDCFFVLKIMEISVRFLINLGYSYQISIFLGP